MRYNPLAKSYALADDVSVNHLAAFSRPVLAS
jgi:hypothetical protein